MTQEASKTAKIQIENRLTIPDDRRNYGFQFSVFLVLPLPFCPLPENSAHAPCGRLTSQQWHAPNLPLRRFGFALHFFRTKNDARNLHHQDEPSGRRQPMLIENLSSLTVPASLKPSSLGKRSRRRPRPLCMGRKTCSRSTFWPRQEAQAP